MEDEVIGALYKQIETIDQEIKAKETILERQRDANRALLEMLIKSEPVDPARFGALTTKGTTIQRETSLPAASRFAWAPCPLESSGRWMHIVRHKLVAGVLIENVHCDKYVADISGTVIVHKSEDDGDHAKEWQRSCNSCVVVLSESSADSLYPRQKNYLRPLEKALLVVVCSSLPSSSLLSSELALVCQASMTTTGTTMDEDDFGRRCLPPMLEPTKWQHWSGELSRFPGYLFDPVQTSLPPIIVVQSVVEAFINWRLSSDESDLKQLLGSLYACQELKSFLYTPGTSPNESYAQLLFRDCISVRAGISYCQLPLFDGIVVFQPKNSSHSNSLILISGWTIEQIDEFVRFSGMTLKPADVLEHCDDDCVDDAGTKSKTARYIAVNKLCDLCTTNSKQQVRSESTKDHAVIELSNGGGKYRELRMDVCAAELLSLF